MSYSGNDSESLSIFPRLVEVPQQWMTPVTYSQERRVIDFQNSLKKQNEEERKEEGRSEILRLRKENNRLSEEIENLRLQPIYDNSADRINVSHELWLKQQQQLLQLSAYKRRYYVAAITLIAMIIIKALMFFHFRV